MLTELAPLCLGVCCIKHKRCTRYQNVNNAPAHLARMGTCRTASGLWPGYQEVTHSPTVPQSRARGNT
jgi:hypothetical protein